MNRVSRSLRLRDTISILPSLRREKKEDCKQSVNSCLLWSRTDFRLSHACATRSHASLSQLWSWLIPQLSKLSDAPLFLDGDVRCGKHVFSFHLEIGRCSSSAGQRSAHVGTLDGSARRTDVAEEIVRMLFVSVIISWLPSMGASSSAAPALPLGGHQKGP